MAEYLGEPLPEEINKMMDEMKVKLDAIMQSDEIREKMKSYVYFLFYGRDQDNIFVAVDRDGNTDENDREYPPAKILEKLGVRDDERLFQFIVFKDDKIKFRVYFVVQRFEDGFLVTAGEVHTLEKTDSYETADGYDFVSKWERKIYNLIV